MIKKFSLSLPSEIVDEISQRYPDVPLSRAVAKILRAGLDSDHPSILSQTAVAHVPTGITNPTELADMVRSIVRAELAQVAPAPTPVIVTEPVVIPNQNIPVPDVQPKPVNNEMGEWLTNNDIYQMIADRYPRNTGTAKISRAVSQGKLVTNGKRRTDMRITKASAIAWLQTI
jgi:hypothetical protein